MPRELTSAQRSLLRRAAQKLPCLVAVGKGGASEGFLRHVRAALDGRELIKVRLLESAGEDRRAAASQFARQAGATLVDLLGRVVILYKPGEHLPPEKRLRLPQR